MAEIQFERRGTPLWKVLLGLLAAGAAAFGGYELLEHTTAGDRPPAAGARPEPPPGATPSPRPSTERAP
jgi:hypothetical protein